MSIEDLQIDQRNARTHDERNLDAIAKSLTKYGQRKPVVYNTGTGVIEAGNGTYLAAKKLGWSHLAAVGVQDDAKTQTGFSLADNRTAELAGWDEVMLAELAAEVQQTDSEFLTDFYLTEILLDVGPAPAVEIKPIDVKPPPPMTWVLVGVPTIHYGEIANQIESVASVDGVLVETTSNNG